MKYNRKKQVLGKRRKVSSYIKRKRVSAPYGRELHVSGVKK